jgi:hypothetical protein
VIPRTTGSTFDLYENPVLKFYALYVEHDISFSRSGLYVCQNWSRRRSIVLNVFLVVELVERRGSIMPMQVAVTRKFL